MGKTEKLLNNKKHLNGRSLLFYLFLLDIKKRNAGITSTFL